MKTKPVQYKAPNFSTWYGMNKSELKNIYIEDNFQYFIDFCIEEYISKYNIEKK